MLRWQDGRTGLWYQVVDQGQREGNYLESSVSAMMMYTYAKGYNKGYLGRKYLKAANEVLDGLIAHRIVANEDATISLTYCCAVSGLGVIPTVTAVLSITSTKEYGTTTAKLPTLYFGLFGTGTLKLTTFLPADFSFLPVLPKQFFVWM